MHRRKLLSEYCLRDGACDSCLETSICLTFIPDHSFEIKFNKNLCANESLPFLRPPPPPQCDRTAEEALCLTCISQVHSLFVRKMRKIAEMTEKKRAMLGVCGCMLRTIAGVSDFSIWNACPLLSEIGYPFSWTRFLTSALKSGQIQRAETRRYSYYLTSFIANCYL